MKTFFEWITTDLKLRNLNEVQQIGFQEVQKNKLFGPVYHGTTEENLKNILNTGFRVQSTLPREGDTRHGYEYSEYGTTGTPVPIHHLGYGVYFTTNKSIAKNYNLGSAKGLKTFYLDAPRLEIINFGSPNTMMKWWQKNGYDMPPIKKLQGINEKDIYQIWIKSTQNLTDNLKSKYDAVWYKGKGLYRLLDGDQVCVYDPTKIYLLNSELNAKNEFLPGDRVKIKEIPVSIKILSVRPTFRQSQILDPFDVLFSQKSNNLFNVDIKPQDTQKILEHYKQRIYKILNSENFIDLMNSRAKNLQSSLEDSIQNYINYYFSSNLKLNFPESLLEKKLAHREKIV